MSGIQRLPKGTVFRTKILKVAKDRFMAIYFIEASDVVSERGHRFFDSRFESEHWLRGIARARGFGPAGIRQ